MNFLTTFCSVRIRIRDPVFIILRSGILIRDPECKKIRIRDPGIWDKHPGSATLSRIVSGWIQNKWAAWNRKSDFRIQGSGYIRNIYGSGTLVSK